MANTRPPTNDPALLAEYEARERRLDRERKFQDDVWAFIGEQRANNTWQREAMTAHEQRDVERFAEISEKHEQLAMKVRGHTQIVMRGRDNWKLLYAVLGALVTVLGVIATLWTFAKGG